MQELCDRCFRPIEVDQVRVNRALCLQCDEEAFANKEAVDASHFRKDAWSSNTFAQRNNLHMALAQRAETVVKELEEEASRLEAKLRLARANHQRLKTQAAMVSAAARHHFHKPEED